MLGLVLAGLAVAVALVAVLGEGNEAPEVGTAPTFGLSDIPPGRKPLIFDAASQALDPDTAASTLDQISALGADAVRIVVNWQYVLQEEARPPDFDPANPASEGYNFGAYDALVRGVKERGMLALLTPSGPFPAWASSSGQSNVADPEPAEFGRFVKALATRYSGRFDPGDGLGTLPAVDLWSVWNEPNLSIFLEPQFRDGRPYSPRLYRSLYIAAYGAIRSVDPDVPVLIGETAPTGSTDSVEPVDFVRGVFCLDPATASDPQCGGTLRTSGWAAHPYATGTTIAPFDAPNNPGFVTMGSLSRLEDALDEAAAAGAVASDLPVVITEFGVQSAPDPRLGVPLLQQAEYLGIAERIAYADPRVASFAQYLLSDDPVDQVPGVEYGGFESGLRSAEGRPKPAYSAFRTPLAVQRNGDRVTLWGLVRPSSGVTEVQIRTRDPGGAAQPLLPLTTDRAGIFQLGSRYVPGRRWQVVWRDPGGRTFRGPWTRAYAFQLHR
jgi:Cellulase (glycosyl hydrolase family 5)